MDMVRVRVASCLVCCLVHGWYSITNILVLNVMHHCCLMFYKRTLYILVFDEIINFQKLEGNLDKMTIANLGRQQQRSLDSYFKSSCELYLSLFEVIGYYCIPSIVLLTLISYTYLCSYYLCFRIPSIIWQLYAICHIIEKTTPR